MRSKILIVSIILGFLVAETSYAQEKKIKTKEYHLKKAKRDKTIALITGATSVVCIATGVIYSGKDGEGIGEVLGNGVTAMFFSAVGVTAGLTCIGFSIGSGYHQKKAASLHPIAYMDRLATSSTNTTGRMAQAMHVGLQIRF